MSKNLDHLLLRHGILTSLSLARKLNDVDTQAMTNKIKLVAKNKNDFDNKMQQAIEKETAGLISRGQIPGVILNLPNVLPPPTQAQPAKDAAPKKLVYNVDKKKLSELYAISALFNREALSNQLTKNDVCFAIYTILNFLEVSQDDFKKFRDDLENPPEQ